MLTVGFSVLLVTLGVSAGLGLPLVALHFEQRSRTQRAHELELARQRAIIADYEATIDAYRQFVQQDPELSLTSR
ncbi:MAG: hypothetical protein WCA31_07980 [Acidimicrobiales bacterium]